MTADLTHSNDTLFLFLQGLLDGKPCCEEFPTRINKHITNVPLTLRYLRLYKTQETKTGRKFVSTTIKGRLNQSAMHVSIQGFL